MSNNEDNILAAFELGAKDVKDQVRDPNDVIVFDASASAAATITATAAPLQHKFNNHSENRDQVNAAINNNNNLIIRVGDDDEDDEDDDNNNQVNAHINNKYGNPTSNNYQKNDRAGGSESVASNGMFLKKEDFAEDNLEPVGNQENNKHHQVAQRAAGIYLEKDEDLERLKAQYEGELAQQQRQIEASNKTFAQNRAAQEKKKKQQQQQQQSKKSQESEKKESNVSQLKKSDFKFDKANKVKNLINDEEELGEIGEWIEKSAQTHKKAAAAAHSGGGDDDSDDSDHKQNDDDDFNYDDDFGNAPPVNSAAAAAVNSTKQKIGQVIHEDDDENDEGEYNDGFKTNMKTSNKFVKKEKQGDADDDEKEEEDAFIGQNQQAKLHEAQQKKKLEEQEITRQKQELVNKKLQQQQILKHKQGPIANRLQDRAKFIELTNPTNSSQAQPTTTALKNEGSITAAAAGAATKVAEEEEEDEEINWEAINQRAIEESNNYKGQQQHSSSAGTTQLQTTNWSTQGKNKNLTFADAWAELKSRNLSDFKVDIIVEQVNPDDPPLGFFEKLLGMCGLGGTQNINGAHLLNERDQIFAIAKMPFNDEDALHFPMLTSIFTALMNGNTNCPRTGGHWDLIGFQGANPATDLRGVGILGLLQILAFISNYPVFLETAQAYSQDRDHNFPMCVTLINVSSLVLQIVRERKANAVINSAKSVIQVVNDLYFAIFYFFFAEYKKKALTFVDVGNLLKEIQALAKANPIKFINDFKDSMKAFNIQQSSLAK